MNVLSALLGAALVIVGVLGAALADRIRGIRHADARPRRQPRAIAPAPSPEEDMARDVELALVKMGYDKAEAHTAVMTCPATDRHSLENWMRCALRRTLAKKAA